MIQHVTQPPDSQKNFLVVDAKTQTSDIEAAFERFTQERKDIAILLINQHVRHLRSQTSSYLSLGEKELANNDSLPSE
jgi:V-type H+-transporting ATPase subunit F